ncbi:hypothetical protein [Clostridium sp. DL-VIII]|uniref:hypothetical protein n=1 Tax=Clostridium sp. DL-VIII TaxID=641107 RepID=UPI00030E2DF2|nr:hypothetical protein [Clostridium sp. DL-VIII]
MQEEVRAVYLDMSKDTEISLGVDLNILINDIYISPFVPKWFKDLIVDIAQKYRVSDKNIIKSKILINK